MARSGSTYRSSRRNAARASYAPPGFVVPFVPQRPPAVHQPDRLTLRSVVRQMVRNNIRYLRP